MHIKTIYYHNPCNPLRAYYLGGNYFKVYNILYLKSFYICTLGHTDLHFKIINTISKKAIYGLNDIRCMDILLGFYSTRRNDRPLMLTHAHVNN